MFKIKKIRVTRIDEFEKASEAIKSADEAITAVGFEIRAVTENGDLMLNTDDLKKLAEEEVKDEATPEESVNTESVE